MGLSIMEYVLQKSQSRLLNCLEKNETVGKAVISLLAMFLLLFSVEANGADQWEMELSWGGPASFTKELNRLVS